MFHVERPGPSFDLPRKAIRSRALSVPRGTSYSPLDLFVFGELRRQSVPRGTSRQRNLFARLLFAEILVSLNTRDDRRNVPRGTKAQGDEGRFRAPKVLNCSANPEDLCSTWNIPPEFWAPSKRNPWRPAGFGEWVQFRETPGTPFHGFIG
jgi:hypothetical protein